MVSDARNAWIDSFYADIGSEVRSARIKAELSQAVLAERVGLTRSSVANLEAGRQRIALHLFFMISQALNIDAQQLLPDSPRVNRSNYLPDLQAHLADSPESAQDFVRGAVARLKSEPDDKD